MSRSRRPDHREHDGNDRRSNRTRRIAIIYARVSKADCDREKASITAQQKALATFALLQDWDTKAVTDIGVSGKSLARPGITIALGLLASGGADVLAAVRLDRISRSVYDVAGLMQRSIDEGWALVTVHGSIDTSTAMGRAYVYMAAMFAELERGITSERSKAGMAHRRSEGVHLGRRTSLPLEVIERIRAERAAGRSHPAIARGLTADRIPTATGRTVWQVSSVQSALTVNPSPSPAGRSGQSRRSGTEAESDALDPSTVRRDRAADPGYGKPAVASGIGAPSTATVVRDHVVCARRW